MISQHQGNSGWSFRSFMLLPELLINLHAQIPCLGIPCDEVLRQSFPRKDSNSRIQLQQDGETVSTASAKAPSPFFRPEYSALT
jgi:hypothetical protein